GMSGIAEVLHNLGYKVTGSDLKEGFTTKHLREIGVEIHKGHLARHVAEADIVVMSSAVRPDNPEITAARARGIPVIPRAEMLAELMRMKYSVAVAGTHGKTTTTSLIQAVLAAGGLDPTAIIGGRINALGTNAKLGASEFMVVEADESDGTFLLLTPVVAVVTNIDPEHLDYYGDFQAVRRTFVEFMNRVPFYGCAIVCLDHPVIQDLLPQVNKRVVTYGFTGQADVTARGVELGPGFSTFEVHARGERLGKVTLKLAGEHNVLNALATVAAAREFDVPFEVVERALAEFGGIHRRFEIKSDLGDVMIVDDYGHHPVEVRATLAAARAGWDRRIIAIFQPHRYTRTRDLFTDFLTAFNDADHVVIAPIYAAGEDPIEGVSAGLFVDEMRARGLREVHAFEKFDEIVAHVEAIARPGDMIITLGAGDIYKVGEELAVRARKSAGGVKRGARGTRPRRK
ncbi:MAG: UDP-N-acetylmuramate--L-alanine ligase, partial [Myxococcales bacterium]|nr:UDP-N-acetylmuramate--L-alanine ligase [Myxococcales bacterium]